MAWYCNLPWIVAQADAAAKVRGRQRADAMSVALKLMVAVGVDRRLVRAAAR